MPGPRSRAQGGPPQERVQGRPVEEARPEIADVKEQVAELIRDVRAGAVDRSDAIACGQLYNVLLRAVSVGLKVRETEELAHEIEELRGILDAQKRARQWD